MSKGNELLDSIFNGDEAPKTTKKTTATKSNDKTEVKAETSDLAPWEQPKPATTTSRMSVNKPKTPEIQETEFAPLSFENYQLARFKEKITFEDTYGSSQVVKVRGVDDPNVVIHMNISNGMFAVDNKQTKRITPLSFEGMFKHLFPGLDAQQDQVLYNDNLRKLYEEKYLSQQSQEGLDGNNDNGDDALTAILAPGEVVKSAVKVAQSPALETKEPAKRTRKTKAQMEATKENALTVQAPAPQTTQPPQPIIEESYGDLVDNVSANVLSGAEPNDLFRNNTTTETTNRSNDKSDFSEVATRFTAALIDLLKAVTSKQC